MHGASAFTVHEHWYSLPKTPTYNTLQCTRRFVYIYVHTHTCSTLCIEYCILHTYTHVHNYVRNCTTHIHTRAPMYVCMYVRMYVCMYEYTSTHIFPHCYSISQCTDGSNRTVPHHLLCQFMQLKLPGTITLMVLLLTVSWRRNVCNLCRLQVLRKHIITVTC